MLILGLLFLYVVIGFFLSSRALMKDDIWTLPQFLGTMVVWPIYLGLVIIPDKFDEYKLWILNRKK